MHVLGRAERLMSIFDERGGAFIGEEPSVEVNRPVQIKISGCFGAFLVLHQAETGGQAQQLWLRVARWRLYVLM